MEPERPLIYVVERDPAVSVLLAEILESDGMDVRQLDSRAIPADAAEVRRVELVVIDFPAERDAREESRRFIGELRAQVAPRRLPVVAVTADYDLLRRAASRLAGLPDFTLLAKPFGVDELLDVVVVMLARARGVPNLPVRSPAAGILVTDEQSRYVGASDWVLSRLGYTLDELKAMRVSDLMVATPRATDDEWSRFQRERTWSGDHVQLRGKDGLPVAFRIHASVLQGASNEPPTYIAWVRALDSLPAFMGNLRAAASAPAPPADRRDGAVHNGDPQDTAGTPLAQT